MLLRLERPGLLDDAYDGYRVSTAAVNPSFFATFDAEPLAGRLLTGADLHGPARVAVVNQSFVTRVLGGRNPIGRHVQYRDVDQYAGQRPPSGTSPPWIEIVGLVRDMGMAAEPDPQDARPRGRAARLPRRHVPCLPARVRRPGSPGDGGESD